MTKEQICDIMSTLPLSAGSYWLVMGAALVMYGIRETTDDIDIGCTPEEFDLLVKTGYHALISKSGLRKLCLKENVSLYEGFYKRNIMYIDGIAVSDVESIRTIKAYFGRAKDLADIELIDRYLARTNQNDQIF